MHKLEGSESIQQYLLIVMLQRVCLYDEITLQVTTHLLPKQSVIFYQKYDYMTNGIIDVYKQSKERISASLIIVLSSLSHSILVFSFACNEPLL
jgi:hypothetical protein